MKKNDHTKILIATDHAGFELKNKIVAYLNEVSKTDVPKVDEKLLVEVEDMGAHKLVEDDDYPAILAPLAMRIASAASTGAEDSEQKTLGIVLGGSGNGEAMVCNRFPGVRAAVYYGGGYIERNDEVGAGTNENKSSLDIVRFAREHNNANILSLGARFLTDEEALAAVRLFIETPFSGDERHARRIVQIDAIE